MHEQVRIVSARESSLQLQPRARYRLRFPASWRHDPVKNRYALALEQGTLDWLERYGIGATAAEREKLRKFDCAAYGGYSLPGAPFSSALLVTQFISLWLFWDDAQVEDDVSWSIDDVVAALTAQLAHQPASRYVAAWSDLGHRLQRMASPAQRARLAQAMREWLHNAKLETALARAYRDEGSCPNLETLFACRTVSIGMYPTFHLIELAEGIELGDPFHGHPATQAVKHLASRLVGLGNDIGGIAKDLQNRWLNLVLVTAEHTQVSLERAFAQVVQLHNDEVLAFDQAAAALPSFGASNDPFVQGWLQAVRHNVYGFALWESQAERYQEFQAIVGDTPLLASLVEG